MFASLGTHFKEIIQNMEKPGCENSHNGIICTSEKPKKKKVTSINKGRAKMWNIHFAFYIHVIIWKKNTCCNIKQKIRVVSLDYNYVRHPHRELKPSTPYKLRHHEHGGFNIPMLVSVTYASGSLLVRQITLLFITGTSQRTHKIANRKHQLTVYVLRFFDLLNSKSLPCCFYQPWTITSWSFPRLKTCSLKDPP